MRQISLFLIALLSALATVAFLVPNEARSISLQLVEHEAAQLNSLDKRKGGGGKGGSSGSSSSSGSSGSSGGGKTGGSSASGATSNSGGRSASGSGARPSYGGAYAGGGAVPYTAGARSPKGIGAVGLLPLAGLGFFGGAWLYAAYLYPYSRPYSYYNTTSRFNETKPVKCLCQQYSVCGCDDNDDPNYMKSIIGDGNPANFNQSLVRVANVNGSDTIFVNGTLPNGTTASGGTDDESSAASLFNSPTAFGWALIAATMVSALSVL